MSESFAFVDAHVHFWDHSIAGLHWRYLDADFDHPRLRGMHKLDAPAFTDVELAEQAGLYRPDKMVHIQSCDEDVPGLESAWVQSLADSRGAPHAIIAKARVADPDLVSVLSANAKHRLFRGYRDMASPLTIGTEAFTTGFHSIADTGASLEVLVPYSKYDDVCALADSRPEMQIVLGHAGLAEHRDSDYFKGWSEHLDVFAKRPNVVVKISALASGADPNWTVESIKPWVRRCVEVFGPERAMFGSNWPIDRLFGTYARLIDAYRECVADLTPQEQESLFVATATGIYNLNDKLNED